MPLHIVVGINKGSALYSIYIQYFIYLSRLRLWYFLTKNFNVAWLWKRFIRVILIRKLEAPNGIRTRQPWNTRPIGHMQARKLYNTLIGGLYLANNMCFGVK